MWIFTLEHMYLRIYIQNTEQPLANSLQRMKYVADNIHLSATAATLPVALHERLQAV